jgi:hypothetical protein
MPMTRLAAKRLIKKSKMGGFAAGKKFAEAPLMESQVSFGLNADLPEFIFL